MAVSLLGPPELHTSLSRSWPSAAKLFVDLFKTDVNRSAEEKYTPLSEATAIPTAMGHTEGNWSATFLSSGNPCLDFFFHVMPDTPPDSFTQRLQAAWEFNPLTTLELICHLRGVRGTGKSDKEGFYAAALWLFKNHPKTLARNVGSIADFGYFKDLLEILYRILEGSNVRQTQKEEWLRRKGLFGWRHRQSARKKKKKKQRSSNSSLPREVRIENAMARSMREKATASALRKKKNLAMANEVIRRWKHDEDFRFLYDSVAEHFAECLKSDMKSLKAEDLTKISLAAKWCPSIDSSFDRSTLLCESIARLVFPRESYPEYEGVIDAHYAYRVRDRLRKEVLVPLRKVLELPEVYIGANQWGSISYNRVASRAMKLYKEKFMKHDEGRFKKYLTNVKSDRAGAFIASSEDSSVCGEMAELRWNWMVQDLLRGGKLDNCIAVCDVSGSMKGAPMDVCLWLGMLVSDLSRDPWKGKIITFSDDPELHLIEGDDLRSRREFAKSMKSGGNANIQKVFDKILDVAKYGRLKKDQMVKRVFVFSDMEFYQATNRFGETDYRAIVRKFTKAGYGSVVPQIVFWNLRYSASTPATETEKGVALVGGFSKNLLKLLLKDDGQIENPLSVMEEAISGTEYQKLVVID